ncbi:SPOR domain-containing protein [Methylobacterium sp. J-076]|uniref:SPOR domain-containing protein n=1 Tax=Methylobacterium sp. J-076 TaxID=2836655 RepID=UPI001FB9501C|nr:SPOR domain-containing protein [Methylobacterium sp. J-076]MCJ2015382.1 SPOR domain-containing protein [Methylobacterium sp. J-076]
MTNASRAQIDLDALARDLRHEDGSPKANKSDPLAELARIVGQDDPFRALLAARDGTPPAAPEDTAPGHDAHWPPRTEPRFAAEEPPRATPADAFDQYLASVERDMQPYPAPEHAGDEGAAEPDETYDDARSLRRAAPRRRFASVGAGIAVVAIAVTGALTYKGMHGTSDGGNVPIVQADSTPLKVAPKVADGVEIPDQNRQIYDRNATSKDNGQIKVVNREEQPLDVAEAARAAGGTSAAQGTTPGNGPFEAFGEPRRVRTVSVKPEAPPTPAPQAEAAPSPVPTMVLPGTEAAPAATAPAPAPVRPAKPVRQAEALPVPAPAATPVAAEPAAAAPAPAPKPVVARKAPQRVASVTPETLGGTSPETTQATSPQVDTTSPVSGFSVQLGVRGSANDARSAFRQMQAKYTQLAGKPELIRQAEVNGKTIFRVRVGPLSKDEASSLCSSLQGSGGQCFVAKN